MLKPSLQFLNKAAQILKGSTLLLPIVLAIGCQDSGFKNQSLVEMDNSPGIFGGSSVEEQSPYDNLVVRLSFSNGPDSLETCTGSWISDQWILTAAHCIPKNESYLKTLKVMTSKSQDSDENPLLIERIVIHPRAAQEAETLRKNKDWEATNIFDLALIKVLPQKTHEVFITRPSFRNIDRLQPDQDIDSLVSLTVLGFGASYVDILEGQRQVPKDLQFAKIFVSNQVTNNTIVVYQKGDVGVCLGDSGAPLFTCNKSQKPKILGVAVSVRNKGSSEVCFGESRFVHLAPHYSWIRETLFAEQ